MSDKAKPKFDGNQGSIGASIAVAVVFLVGWEWGPGFFNIPPYIIPSASSVYFEFIDAIERENLFFHTGITLLETIAGFIIGSLMGMIIGYILGISPKAEFVFSPYILALQIAPKVAFAPLFVVWFGFTVYPKILVAVLIIAIRKGQYDDLEGDGARILMDDDGRMPDAVEPEPADLTMPVEDNERSE